MKIDEVGEVSLGGSEVNLNAASAVVDRYA
jgi:hypothetical protein